MVKVEGPNSLASEWVMYASLGWKKKEKFPHKNYWYIIFAFVINVPTVEYDIKLQEKVVQRIKHKIFDK
jgi:hypothetical protein